MHARASSSLPLLPLPFPPFSAPIPPPPPSTLPRPFPPPPPSPAPLAPLLYLDCPIPSPPSRLVMGVLRTQVHARALPPSRLPPHSLAPCLHLLCLPNPAAALLLVMECFKGFSACPPLLGPFLVPAQPPAALLFQCMPEPLLRCPCCPCPTSCLAVSVGVF